MFGIRLSVTTSLAIMNAIMQVHGSAVDLTEKRQTGIPGQVVACGPTMFSIFTGISDLASSGNDNKVTGFTYGSDGVAELQLAAVERSWTAMMRVQRQWNLRVLLTMLACKRVHKKRLINRIFYWVGQNDLCTLAALIRNRQGVMDRYSFCSPRSTARSGARFLGLASYMDRNPDYTWEAFFRKQASGMPASERVEFFAIINRTESRTAAQGPLTVNVSTALTVGTFKTAYSGHLELIEAGTL
ncbi:hypothetical protein B0H13DRAFT_1874635 [Mycena leptocephala]|nr:hypothetical protein B0H13DRAFT_1874635 [Mycena leptocephala]